MEQEATDEEASHLRQLEQTKQQVVRDKQGRLQAEIDAVAVSEEQRKEVCTYVLGNFQYFDTYTLVFLLYADFASA